MKKKILYHKKIRKTGKTFWKILLVFLIKTKKYQIKDTNNKFRFDLHGLTLNEANKKVKEIVKYCSGKNYKEILLITGKGLHSNKEDVYKSSNLSKIRFSVPDFINSDPEISKLILSMDNPPQKDGGEGALLIRLKKL